MWDREAYAERLRERALRDFLVGVGPHTHTHPTPRIPRPTLHGWTGTDTAGGRRRWSRAFLVVATAGIVLIAIA